MSVELVDSLVEVGVELRPFEPFTVSCPFMAWVFWRRNAGKMKRNGFGFFSLPFFFVRMSKIIERGFECQCLCLFFFSRHDSIKCLVNTWRREQTGFEWTFSCKTSGMYSFHLEHVDMSSLPRQEPLEQWQKGEVFIN